MIKRPFRFMLRTLVLVLAVSGMHYLWIAIFWYPGDLSLFWKSVTEQRPVHIKIKATDQFGKPAANFRVKAQILWISRYWWLFPLWASHESTCVLETDQKGNAGLSYPLRKVLMLEFKEMNMGSYIFPVGKQDPYDLSFNNNPRGPIQIRNLDRFGQVIDMKVLRHGPPVKLTGYRPEVPGWGPKVISSSDVGIPVQDEMVFTVDVMGNKFLEGRHPGDIVITVKNAKTACEMFTKIYTPGLDFKEDGKWEARFEALDGTVIQRAESHQFLTFAPDAGYKKRLTYVMKTEREVFRPEVADFKGPDGGLWKVIQSTLDEENYASIEPQELFRGTLYLRHHNPRWYGVLTIGFDLMYREGKLRIKAHGAYNPDGSTNLWSGSKVYLGSY